MKLPKRRRRLVDRHEETKATGYKFQFRSLDLLITTLILATILGACRLLNIRPMNYDHPNYLVFEIWGSVAYSFLASSMVFAVVLMVFGMIAIRRIVYCWCLFIMLMCIFLKVADCRSEASFFIPAIILVCIGLASFVEVFLLHFPKSFFFVSALSALGAVGVLLALVEMVFASA